MEPEIYKITLINLSKASLLADFPYYISPFTQLQTYLKADIKEEDQWRQNKENVKFVIHVAKGITANAHNENVFGYMQYFVNLFIEKHYDYSRDNTI